MALLWCFSHGACTCSLLLPAQHAALATLGTSDIPPAAAPAQLITQQPNANMCSVLWHMTERAYPHVVCVSFRLHILHCPAFAAVLRPPKTTQAACAAMCKCPTPTIPHITPPNGQGACCSYLKGRTRRKPGRHAVLEKALNGCVGRSTPALVGRRCSAKCSTPVVKVAWWLPSREQAPHRGRPAVMGVGRWASVVP